eukprot:CAMPEP_0183722922 /NCGR_PEP_ID=MMETSP0737-20130205/14723_1 /TAXON_ID=385413 /ORGANISM="Thalassiosira miniscula, Strain CCMP1093" /LENGTH=396 /DNA_ID=CAMNT_0025953169 /DNA_START=221 /DNA_END=1411 /DNA_ORIENTATION=-
MESLGINVDFEVIRATMSSRVKKAVGVVAESHFQQKSATITKCEASKNPRVISHVLMGTMERCQLADSNVHDEDTSKSPAQPMPLPSDSPCAQNLAPVPVPQNPINEEWEQASPLQRELAWILEESAIILPSRNRSYNAVQSPTVELPLALDFAWLHASLVLREFLMNRFPDEVNSMIKLLREMPSGVLDQCNSELAVVVNVRNLLLQNNVAPSTFDDLRKEVRDALRLGYRRSESIGLTLDLATEFRVSNMPRKQSKRLRDNVMVVGGKSVQCSQESWKCHNCASLNALIRGRCHKCQGWKGGKREDLWKENQMAAATKRAPKPLAVASPKTSASAKGAASLAVCSSLLGDIKNSPGKRQLHQMEIATSICPKKLRLSGCAKNENAHMGKRLFVL